MCRCVSIAWCRRRSRDCSRIETDIVEEAAGFCAAERKSGTGIAVDSDSGLQTIHAMHPPNEEFSPSTSALKHHRSSTSVLGIRTISAILSVGFAVLLRAEDWPQWRGLDRDGVWHETGILQSFPPGGLKVLWRVPVGTGFSSPVVAQGRVYV